MIISSGLGYLVVVIVFVNSLFAEIITRTVTGNDQFYQQSSIPLVVSLLFSIIPIHFLGEWLNTRKAKTHIDKKTARAMLLKENHSLFFIKMEYWWIIIFIITIILLIKDQMYPLRNITL